MTRVSTGRRVAGVALMAGGVLAVAVGLFLSVGYVTRALEVLDQPDRSWLFWGVGIFLEGIGLAVFGAVLAALGWWLRRPSGG